MRPSPQADEPRPSRAPTPGPSTPASARAVLLAGGSSTRMQLPGQPHCSKPWLDLCGRPILEVSAAALTAAPEVQELIIVARPEEIEQVLTLAEGNSTFDKLVAVVPGGAQRFDSVCCGARASQSQVDVLLIHDAARPLIDPATVRRAIQVAHTSGAALVAVPVSDTIKESSDGRSAAKTLDRARLWAAQTPQCFAAEKFLELLKRAELEGFQPTDDAALWERWVGAVSFVAGSSLNRKITTPEDLQIARAVLRELDLTRSQELPPTSAESAGDLRT